MEMIPSSRLGFLRGVFLANHLASTDNQGLCKLWKVLEFKINIPKLGKSYKMVSVLENPIKALENGM